MKIFSLIYLMIIFVLLFVSCEKKEDYSYDKFLIDKQDEQIKPKLTEVKNSLQEEAKDITDSDLITESNNNEAKENKEVQVSTNKLHEETLIEVIPSGAQAKWYWKTIGIPITLQIENNKLCFVYKFDDGSQLKEYYYVKNITGSEIRLKSFEPLGHNEYYIIDKINDLLKLYDNDGFYESMMLMTEIDYSIFEYLTEN